MGCNKVGMFFAPPSLLFSPNDFAQMAIAYLRDIDIELPRSVKNISAET